MAALVALPAFKAWTTKAMAKNTLKKTTEETTAGMMKVEMTEMVTTET